MSEVINDWGLYPWFAEHGEECFHPDDVQKLKELQPNGRVFQKVGENEGFLVLKYRDQTYRVRPGLYKPVAAPAFHIGEQVRAKDKPDVLATIRDISWHYKNNAPVYYLTVNGKKKSRRYWSEELESAQ